MKILTLTAILLLSTALYAQEKKPELTDTAKMKVYYMVFLKTGPNRSQLPEEAKQIQAAHLAHLDKLYEDGKISLAGPFMDKGDIRGIVVYNIEDESEVRRLAEADPAVKAGRLVVEIHPWFALSGSYLK